MRRSAAVGVLAAALIGCAGDLPRDRAWVSGEIAKRAGHDLRRSQSRRFETPPGVALADGLTSDEAVALALWNNAALQADLAQLGFARADLADAGVLPNPIFSFLFPVGPKQAELSLKWSLSWLWQRPKRVAAAGYDAERVAHDLVQHGLDLVRDVKVAHADVLLAEELQLLADADEQTLREISGLTEIRLREGDATALEDAAIRADARSAEVERGQATMGAQVARAKLAVLLGLGRQVPRLEPTPPAAGPTPTVAEWTEMAMAARPDLRAAEIAIEAAAARGGLERARIVELVGVLDGNQTDDGWDLGPGLELPLPIFDQRLGGRIRARAELERAAWQYVQLRREIAREVLEAHARLERARAALRTWEADVLPARESVLRIARTVYETGSESHLVVLDAVRAMTSARRRRAELAAEGRRAAAELERSVGGRPGTPRRRRAHVAP